MDQATPWQKPQSSFYVKKPGREETTACRDDMSHCAKLSIKMERCGLGFVFSEPSLKTEAVVRLFYSSTIVIHWIGTAFSVLIF